MKRQLRTHVAALMLLAPAAVTLVAEPAVAQARRAAPAPEIHTLGVNADNGLQPGSQISFALEATPGGKASIALGRTNIVVGLKQTSAGMYRGTYTVRRSDRIDPTALMTARLTRGNRTLTHEFSWPGSFQALAMGSAPAPAPAPVAAPRIDRFMVVPVGRLEPGRELRFRLHGVPGATATLEIPGIVSNIAMREVNPGEYVGTYTVRQRDNLDAFDSAVATLRSGDRWATSRIDRPFVRERERDRDNAAPTIGNLSPRHGEVVSSAGRTEISGTFDDNGRRGVNPETVRLTVGGRDVTASTHVTPERFSYRSDLPPGRYTAEVIARDYAGNQVSKSWTFDVGTSVGSPSGGRLPLSLVSPTNNATVDASGNVYVQGRTAPFATVRVQVEAVTPMVGNRLGVAQTVASETVQADRDGHFSLNVSPRGGIPLPGTRYDISVSANQGAQNAESRLTLFHRS